MSAYRSFAQIPDRIQFFLAVSETTYSVPKESVDIPSIVTETEWPTYLDLPEVGATEGPSLYRDMGKQVTVVNSSGQAVEKYRLVQKVNGPTSEGVPDEPPSYDVYYVKVWSADGNGVTVVRTG